MSLPQPGDDETLDPQHGERAREPAERELSVALEIAAHPDFSRIGEIAVLGRALDPALAAPRPIGRHTPLFRGASGAERPLDDPCSSREQLVLRWANALSLFAIELSPAARRSVELFDESGRALGAPPRDVPASSYVALGDRVLLRLCLIDPSALADDLGLAGSSSAMHSIRRQCRALADLDHAVLISGPVGAGKEVVARAIHAASDRRGGPFVAVNCAALPESLVESELFGHVKGAFSGALADRSGVFRAASGGTLLLDEVAELPPTAQSKLLRAIELRAVRPLGSATEQPVDVRVLAATHRDLDAAARAGSFRTDLLSRLGALRIRVPPLDEHREDILPLFARFLCRIAGARPGSPLSQLVEPASEAPSAIPLSFCLALLSHPMPNNVRDLDAIAARVAAAILAGQSPDATLTPALPEPASAEAIRPDTDRLISLLEEHDFVQSRAARVLGVSHSTIDRWMQELGIPRPRDLSAAEVRAALDRARGDVPAAARALRVSERGLVLRMRELGIETGQ